MWQVRPATDSVDQRIRIFRNGPAGHLRETTRQLVRIAEFEHCLPLAALGRMLGMSSSRGESVGRWYERAIVASSLAADAQESLAHVGNDIAKRVARKRAEEAAADLDLALDALQAERRHSRQRLHAVSQRTGN